MIWIGAKERLAKRAKQISKGFELWNIFPKDWQKPEYWWEPFRFYFRFVITASIPRKWYPHKSDGWGLCSYCRKVTWIEDRPINNRCNNCRQWIEQVEQAMREELNEQQQKIWDTCKWTNQTSLSNTPN